MKKIIFLLLFLLLLTSSNLLLAQFKIDPSGRIGIGTNYPNPDFKVHIKGNLLLTTYPEIPPDNSNPVSFVFKVGNGWPGAEFGTNNSEYAIAAWSTDGGYNKLYAKQFISMSDSNYKTNINPIENCLTKVLALKSYSYQFKYDTIIDRKITYGFLAQEVEQILPNVIDSAKNVKLMDYLQIIPIVVQAMQEQQEVIDSLKNSLSESLNANINNQTDIVPNLVEI